MSYYIPQWEERTSYGFRRIDPYAMLFEDRIIYMGTPISDDVANAVIAQLLCLQTMNPDADISIYINSPGGSVDAGMAMYDTMQFISNDVVTLGMGLAASMGQFLLNAGTPGKRYALPHTRIMMHQPSGGIGGSASDIKIQAEESKKLKATLIGIIAERCGKPVEQVAADAERDRWFSADEAMEYGLVDHVITNAREARA